MCAVQVLLSFTVPMKAWVLVWPVWFIEVNVFWCVLSAGCIQWESSTACCGSSVAVAHYCWERGCGFKSRLWWPHFNKTKMQKRLCMLMSLKWSYNPEPSTTASRNPLCTFGTFNFNLTLQWRKGLLKTKCCKSELLATVCDSLTSMGYTNKHVCDSSLSNNGSTAANTKVVPPS